MRNEVWVDFKLPILNEWYPESYWSGRGKKETDGSIAQGIGRPSANWGPL